MAGRSMMNIMIYIFQNYQSHFKDLKVDSIEKEFLSLTNAQISNKINSSNTTPTGIRK